MTKTITKSRAEQINQLHMECLASIRTGVQKAIQIGELLIEQKKECGHGNWISWIEDNLNFGRPQAWRYMRCYHMQKAILPNVASKQLLTIEEYARVTAKPSKEELEEAAQREKELNDLAEIEAKKRIAATAKEQEIAEEKSKIEVIEMEVVEFEDFNPALAELKESEEEFEKRVQGMIEMLQEDTAEERKAKQIPDKDVAKQSLKVWESICNHEPLEAVDRQRLAKILIKVLYKKYPQLMDEPSE